MNSSSILLVLQYCYYYRYCYYKIRLDSIYLLPYLLAGTRFAIDTVVVIGIEALIPCHQSRGREGRYQTALVVIIIIIVVIAVVDTVGVVIIVVAVVIVVGIAIAVVVVIGIH